MYRNETVDHHQIWQILIIQQRHIRNISKIKWDQYPSKREVLTRAGLEDMEVKLVRNRLRWLGHVSRMEDERPVKVLLFGELNDSKRPFGRPKIRYKYT